MGIWIIRDREAGNIIDYTLTRTQAEEMVRQYEAIDAAEEIYTPDFYEIIEISERDSKNKRYRHIIKEA